MFTEKKKLFLIITILFVMSFVSVVLYANCDMIGMLAKEDNTISQFGNSSGTYEYPLDFFEYLMERSINSGTKPNPNGYGVIFYHSNSTIITYDPTNLYNEDNEAWYLVDTDYNDYYYHGSEYTTGYDDNNALNQAYDVILNQHGCENTEASIVLGHARKGTTGTGSHPFRFNLGDKTFTFIQNGGLENGITPNEPNIKLAIHTELNSLGWFSNHSFNWIDNPANATINQFIDSELLFHWIMKNIIDTNGSILEGCNRALTATVDGIDLSQELLTPYGYHDWINCVNFILSDGEKLYVFRNSESEYPNNDIWHNLSYSELDEFYAIKTYGTELNTRIDQYDMVCFSKDEAPIEYPNFLDIDIKTFASGVTWTSCPRLTEQGIYEDEEPPSIFNQMFEQAYYVNGDPGLLQETSGTTGTINGLINILGKRDGTDMKIEPDGDDFINHDINFDNMLFRHEGYKIEVAVGADPTVLIVDGDRLPIDHVIAGSMTSGEYHWLGFWLPQTQEMIESFGDFWQYVEKVKSEDWFYSPANNQRGDDPLYPIALSAENLTLEYGKSYLVLFNEEVEDFYWTDSGATEEPRKKAESESFTYTEKADYEAIDVFNIPPNVTEIGVFEDEVCVGAVVIEDSCAQILVYSDSANRDPVPFTFEIVTGRGFSTPTKDYLVLNQMTGEFEPSVIISGRQGYSTIKLGEQEEPENIVAIPILLGNYPNPFNPITTISFSLPTEQDIELTIYNIKGQKVRTLYSGIADEGEHTITWSGKDSNDKSVSSGLYLYKLKTNNEVLTRKMLMMK